MANKYYANLANGAVNYWSYDPQKRFITIEDIKGNLVNVSIARLYDCVPTILNPPKTEKDNQEAENGKA